MARASDEELELLAARNAAATEEWLAQHSDEPDSIQGLASEIADSIVLQPVHRFGDVMLFAATVATTLDLLRDQRVEEELLSALRLMAVDVSTCCRASERVEEQ